LAYRIEPKTATESRLSRSCIGALLGIALSSVMTLAIGQESPTEFRVIPLTAGIHVIRAEVALAPDERSKGLMFRKALGPNQGMVFLFDEPAVQCMWMRNTLIPLSVAFIADDGRILNVEDMAPQTEDNHCAAKPARYALEMNKGWFVKHGIAAGAKISGLPRATQ
jgi:uncharacterized membrane protein (UPF0127 family)